MKESDTKQSILSFIPISYLRTLRNLEWTDFSVPSILTFIPISYLKTLRNLEWTDFLVFDHKVEFGYSFGGQMTPDQLNNM